MYTRRDSNRRWWPLNRRRGDFYFRPSRRRRFRLAAAVEREEPTASDEGLQVWRIAWWGDGWGVWAGRHPDLTAPPVYSTGNIPHFMHEAASNWALGVVPPNPGTVITCAHRGDPAAAM